MIECCRNCVNLVPCNGLRCNVNGKYKKVKPDFVCDRYEKDDMFGISIICEEYDDPRKKQASKKPSKAQK